ncbi:MAG TPA: hypothetical protein VMX38_13410 [Verrucomicrobiae bacterium]|jgi:hypothetical protein|nr:hypothetical protein [Verrucomicrobiae bacterium]
MNGDHPIESVNDRKASFSAKDEFASAPSRFLDEKISEESCTETKSDSALKPAGLSNPFWK